MNTILVKKYENIPLNHREIYRYMGCSHPDRQIESLTESCISELLPTLSCRVCYTELEVAEKGDLLDLSFAVVKSADLKKNLRGCRKIILFAATIGLGTDRLIARYSRTSPAKALCFQAIGAERIESLCDVFNKEVSQQCRRNGVFTRPRFSPGYGDLPLDVQKSIFSVLDCPRKIGLSLNESLLMSPSKSVTAIIGLGDNPCEDEKENCIRCSKSDCHFRRI